MSSKPCSAFLIPDFPTCAEGRVHSVFKRTVNVEFKCNGESRLLTIISKQLPRLPDSIQVEEGVLDNIQEGMHASWRNNTLSIGGLCIKCNMDNGFSGKISDISDKLIPSVIDSFISSTAHIFCGLDKLPSDYKKKVTDALCSGELSRYIGLGAGLTPSFDDACVGYMGICRAFGVKIMPIKFEDTDTTDISLRYLKLAQQGYFGEPICNIISSFTGEGDLRSSIEALMAVGATSGCDMLYGMKLAIKTLLKPKT